MRAHDKYVTRIMTIGIAESIGAQCMLQLINDGAWYEYTYRIGSALTAAVLSPTSS